MSDYKRVTVSGNTTPSPPPVYTSDDNYESSKAAIVAEATSQEGKSLTNDKLLLHVDTADQHIVEKKEEKEEPTQTPQELKTPSRSARKKLKTSARKNTVSRNRRTGTMSGSRTRVKKSSSPTVTSVMDDIARVRRIKRFQRQLASASSSFSSSSASYVATPSSSSSSVAASFYQQASPRTKALMRKLRESERGMDNALDIIHKHKQQQQVDVHASSPPSLSSSLFPSSSSPRLSASATISSSSSVSVSTAAGLRRAVKRHAVAGNSQRRSVSLAEHRRRYGLFKPKKKKKKKKSVVLMKKSANDQRGPTRRRVSQAAQKVISSASKFATMTPYRIEEHKYFHGEQEQVPLMEPLTEPLAVADPHGEAKAEVEESSKLALGAAVNDAPTANDVDAVPEGRYERGALKEQDLRDMIQRVLQAECEKLKELMSLQQTQHQQQQQQQQQQQSREEESGSGNLEKKEIEDPAEPGLMQGAEEQEEGDALESPLSHTITTHDHVSIGSGHPPSASDVEEVEEEHSDASMAVYFRGCIKHHERKNVPRTPPLQGVREESAYSTDGNSDKEACDKPRRDLWHRRAADGKRLVGKATRIPNDFYRNSIVDVDKMLAIQVARAKRRRRKQKNLQRAQKQGRRGERRKQGLGTSSQSDPDWSDSSSQSDSNASSSVRLFPRSINDSPLPPLVFRAAVPPEVRRKSMLEEVKLMAAGKQIEALDKQRTEQLIRDNLSKIARIETVFKDVELRVVQRDVCDDMVSRFKARLDAIDPNIWDSSSPRSWAQWSPVS
jgi:hypothetical protein